MKTNIRTNIKRLAATFAATLAVATAVAVGPADAAVVSSTGAAIETLGACGNGNVAMSIESYGFDYVTSIPYFYGIGWGSWNAWTALSDGEQTEVQPMPGGVYMAVYMYYADWNGYSWEFGGEYVDFGGTVWCSA